MQLDKVICGDNMNVMPHIPDESVDLIVTDPPYGIAFMGKSWDRALPPIDVWRECLRVLKPGAFAFIMCIPRQDCQAQMIMNLAEAGFEVDYTPIYWAYATGFPKAMNMSKAVDKRLGMEREVVGFKPSHRPNRVGGRSPSLGGGVYTPAVNTISASPEAKALDGAYAGFQPKPAVECILVCMKPLSEKTYIDQALKNGKGVTWLDSVRIPHGGQVQCQKGKSGFAKGYDGEGRKYTNNGRFPANILISDDVLNDGINHKSGGTGMTNNSWFESDRRKHTGNSRNDSGSFSRYFSLDAWAQKHLPDSVLKTFPFLLVPKASKSEKNAGLDGLEDKQMYKCDSSGNSLEIFGTTDGGRKPRKNNHPTVKPVKLMAYLITMGSREGDIVLDPYLGSGTTAVACVLKRRHFIGCDIDPVSCETADLRVEYARCEIAKEDSKQLDMSADLFGR